ncbi:MAG: P-II family nitrogen regulator [Nitrospirae bacterium]|nr:P-II family nitrogen regulator [Nitrospirota bacterium]
MKKIKCYIRSEKLGEVKEALIRIVIQGMTILEVRGFGIRTHERGEAAVSI